VNRYSLVVKRSAQKELFSLPENIALRVSGVIDMLATDPFPHGVIKLTDRSEWRLRVGDYRVLYEVDTKTRAIEITAIRHRKEAY
jgi:mRNA interferase RelE/StbE